MSTDRLMAGTLHITYNVTNVRTDGIDIRDTHSDPQIRLYSVTSMLRWIEGAQKIVLGWIQCEAIKHR
jgi:hypothetical protein